MSVRQDLAQAIRDRYVTEGIVLLTDPSPTDFMAADAVLDWLDGLDPDADAELTVWHLRESKKELARLRVLVATLRRDLEVEVGR